MAQDASRLKRGAFLVMKAVISTIYFFSSRYYRRSVMADFADRGLAKPQRPKADAAAERPASALAGGWDQTLSQDQRRIACLAGALLGVGLWLKGGAIFYVVAIQEAGGAAAFSIFDAAAIVSPPVWAGLAIVLGFACFWRGLRFVRGKQEKIAISDAAIAAAGLFILVYVPVPAL